MQQPRRLLQARACVEKVLREFDVTYQWINEHSLTVEVWVQQRRFQHTYPQTALHNPLPILSQAERNSIADLRRKLNTLHARPKEPRMPSDPEEPPVPLAVPTPAERPEPSLRDESPTIISPPVPAASPPAAEVSTTSPEAHPNAPEPAAPKPPDPLAAIAPVGAPAEPSASAQEPAWRIDDADARLLYKTTVLQAAEVISIVLDRPLNAVEGDVLIIPLHDPQHVVCLPAAQFRAFFKPASKPEPVAQPIPRPVSQAPKESVVQQEPPAKKNDRLGDAFAAGSKAPEPSEAPAVYPPPIAEKPAVQAPEPPSRLVWSRPEQSPPAKPAVLASAKEPVAARPIRRGEPIPLQIARLLHAVGYAQSQLNRPIHTSDIGRHVLSPEDRRQFAARMPGAVNKGWVIRHDPTQDFPRYRYGLSRHGRELLRQMGTRPWEGDDLPVPAWLQLATGAG